MREEAPEAADRRHARAVALWSGLGFVLLQFGWILVMPPATGIDEFDHVYRASSVQLGHWEPAERRLPAEIGRGGLVPVRSDLVAASSPACARLPYTSAFNCRPYRELGGGVVEVASAADAYNPTFYAVVGSVARHLQGSAAIDAMRVVSAALCALTFMVAVYLTARWSRTRWPPAALILAALPTTIYSTIVVAPNGLNMMGGLLVWTAIAALLSENSALRTSAYAALMGGVAVLANTHTLGLLWVSLIGVTAIAYVGPRRVWIEVRPRTRSEGAALLLAVAGLAFAVWWVWYARPNMAGQAEVAFPGNPWSGIAMGPLLWLLQAIGAFPLRNEPAPMLLYAVALLALIAFAIATLRALRGERAVLRTLLVVLFVGLAVPVILSFRTYATLGLAWQGRYGMPYSVGLFVVAAVALDRRLASPRSAVLTVGVATWALAHVVGQVGVLREHSGDHVLVAATGWWAPPTMLLVALGVLAATAWIFALRPADQRLGTGPVDAIATG